MARGLMKSIDDTVVNGFVEVVIRVVSDHDAVAEVKRLLDEDAVIDIREVLD